MKDKSLEYLNSIIDGEVYDDYTSKIIYSTDASAYREVPKAVIVPKNKTDLTKIIKFANQNNISIIPRTAGTSLAGQVVGKGMIIDVSKHLNKILEINVKEKWVKVEPGVIRDELNQYLKPYGFLFGPETSTSNRAMIGGMIGNNSCGSNSLIYGSTRENLISTQVLLSNGNEVEFGEISKDEFKKKCQSNTLEGKIYRNINKILSDDENRIRIDKEYPKSSIKRRNTGYAIDLLKDTEPFIHNSESFNFCKMIAGSEGTLAFITEAKLKITPLPAQHKSLICVHFNELCEAFHANLIALKYHPYAVELIDHYIIDCTKESIGQAENRFFIKETPKAIMIVELIDNQPSNLDSKIKRLISELKKSNYGYYYPVISGNDIQKVWNLRKAGLGLLSNIPGDAKPVPVIEDTAVDVKDLPNYIEEFNIILKKYNLYCVHYAHIGSGELHLRPLINLKTKDGKQLFRTILEEIAQLVKKYKGSLSGEHGDGRLRGEFIPNMIGIENYALLKEIKKTWDPNNIFNPNKIINTPKMNHHLRYSNTKTTNEVNTFLNFTKTQGLIRAAEQCNGSGDCRKTHFSGGTMCPSYMATKNEKDSTRARANMVREIFNTRSPKEAINSKEVKEIMNLCISCKGCQGECPSNVDIGKIKAELTYQYNKVNGLRLNDLMIGHFEKINAIMSKVPWLYRLLMNSKFSAITKIILGIHQKRTLPTISKISLSKWFDAQSKKIKTPINLKGTLVLFCDEFTNYNESELGTKTILLLQKLGYIVKMVGSNTSGRTFISKGMLEEAKNIAQENIRIFSKIISEKIPLVGIEPSAILTFRDEYKYLVDKKYKKEVNLITKNTYTIEEFLSKEIDSKNIVEKDFKNEERLIKIHGHCHQKALSSLVHTKKILSMPQNYKTEIIPSGCCGMAGFFGYEKKYYNLSMEIGELVLFPKIRECSSNTIISASGTSCRHQIKDGTARVAYHPVEILFDALA